MEVKIHRSSRVGEATLGELWVEDTLFRCHTLEDLERVVKIKTKTAIPVGRYKMKLSMSKKFSRITLEVLDVPNYDGIRIHCGNDESHTEGCPLVAWSRSDGRVIRSRPCELALTSLAIQADQQGESLWLTVTSDMQPL